PSSLGRHSYVPSRTAKLFLACPRAYARGLTDSATPRLALIGQAQDRQPCRDQAQMRRREIVKKALNLAAFLLPLAMVAAAQTIPAGAKITIRTGSALSSATARTGQAFEGTLARDLVAGGETIAKAGAPVSTTAYHAKGKSHTRSN